MKTSFITDRKTVPATSSDFRFQFLQPEKFLLDNGAEVYMVTGGEQEVVKIEFVFPAGNIYDSSHLVSNTVCDMLEEGTRQKSSDEISESFDFYGAYINKEVTRDHASISLFCLEKFLPEVLPLFVEILTESTFPEQELELILKNKKARFESNLKKVEYIGRNYFGALIFGNHPYGQATELFHYDQLQREELIDFYRQYYLNAPYPVFVTGKVSENSRQYIYQTLSGMPYNPTIPQNHASALQDIPPSRKEMPMEGAIQSAIRIGKRLFTMDTFEYPAFQLLNTIFGGYYGSRLMQNIRQDKGYTYGIHSMYASMQQSGSFVIATEVGKVHTEATIEEIHKEISRLRTEKIPQAEFEMGKNYVLGNFLKSLDGPFSQADKLKQKVLKGLDHHFYENYISRLKALTPEDLQESAIQHLSPDSLSMLIAG